MRLFGGTRVPNLWFTNSSYAVLFLLNRYKYPGIMFLLLKTFRKKVQPSTYPKSRRSMFSFFFKYSLKFETAFFCLYAFTFFQCGAPELLKHGRQS
jgi:hypothetical protein